MPQAQATAYKWRGHTCGIACLALERLANGFQGGYVGGDQRLIRLLAWVLPGSAPCARPSTPARRPLGPLWRLQIGP